MKQGSQETCLALATLTRKLAYIHRRNQGRKGEEEGGKEGWRKKGGRSG